MRIGIIADIHSNLHALQAVEAELERKKVDEVWCLGDIIGYGAFPNECLKWVFNNCSKVILGNHELAILGFIPFENLNDYAAESLKWTREKINKVYVEKLLATEIQTITDGIQLVHDTPESPGSMVYILNESQAYKALISQTGEICFFAHTHLPTIYTLKGGSCISIKVTKANITKGRFLINPGSIGQPRDGNPKASFIIYENGTIEFHRVEYNVKEAARAILKAGLPKFLAARLLVGA